MAEPRYQKYKDQGLQAWILLSEDANGDSPSLEYCKGIRDQYGLTMPVLIDPDGVLPGALGYAVVWSATKGPLNAGSILAAAIVMTAICIIAQASRKARQVLRAANAG